MQVISSNFLNRSRSHSHSHPHGINLHRHPSLPLGRCRGNGLDLNLWQRRRLAAKVCLPCVGVLRVVVGDCGFDGIFSKHGAMYYKQLVSRPYLLLLRNGYSRFTGGRQSSFAISVFLILDASSSVIPRTNSVR